MKKIIFVVLALVFIIVVWQLYPTEKKRFKNDINDLRKAFENEDAAQVIDYLDSSYEDFSYMTRDEFIETVEHFFEQVTSIKVQMSGLKLSIDSIGENNVVYASCSLGLKVLASYEGERVLAFGGIVHPSPVWAWFRKSDGKYRVYQAKY